MTTIQASGEVAVAASETSKQNGLTAFSKSMEKAYIKATEDAVYYQVTFVAKVLWLTFGSITLKGARDFNSTAAFIDKVGNVAGANRSKMGTIQGRSATAHIHIPWRTQSL